MKTHSQICSKIGVLSKRALSMMGLLTLGALSACDGDSDVFNLNGVWAWNSESYCPNNRHTITILGDMVIGKVADEIVLSSEGTAFEFFNGPGGAREDQRVRLIYEVGGKSFVDTYRVAGPDRMFFVNGEINGAPNPINLQLMGTPLVRCTDRAQSAKVKLNLPS